MLKKIAIGLFSSMIIGMLMTSIFLPVGTPLFEIFWTKITATSIIVGLLTSIYGHFSKSKLQVFVISIFIGMIVFNIKYWITGHHFDPTIMGAFTGAILGVIYAIVRKSTHSLKLHRKLKILREKGFNYYA